MEYPLFYYKQKLKFMMPLSISVYAIFLITESERVEMVKMESLEKQELFKVVMGNAYRRSFVKGLKLERNVFEQAAQTCTSIIGRRIIRPSKRVSIKEVADSIELEWTHS